MANGGFYKLSQSERQKRICMTILFVIYAIVCLALAVAAAVQFAVLKDQFNLLIGNWDQDVITDISIVNYGQNCAAGSSPFFTYEFKGTMRGCDCLGKSNSAKNVQSKVYASSCNYNMTSVGCAGITPVNGKSFQQMDGQILCVTRLSGYSFKDKFWKPDQTSCKSGEKLCGSVLKTQFCVPTSSNCPITDIYVQDSTHSAAPDSVKYSNVGTYYSSNIWVSRELNTAYTPLVEGRFTESLVCMSNNKPNRADTRASYILFNQQDTKCSTTDPRFTLIGKTQSESAIFAENGYTTNLSNLPGFVALSTSAMWGQFIRNYIPWETTKDCRKQLDGVVQSVDKFNTMSTLLLLLMIINILAAILISIVMAIMEVMNLFGYDLPCINGDGDEELAKLNKVKKVTKWIIRLIQLPIMITCVVLASNLRYIIHNNFSCSDSYTNDLLTLLGKEISQTAFKNNIVQLVMLVVFVFVDIAASRSEDAKIQKQQDDEKLKTQPQQIEMQDGKMMQQQMNPEMMQQQINPQMMQQQMNPQMMYNQMNPQMMYNQMNQNPQMMQQQAPMLDANGLPIVMVDQYGNPVQQQQQPQQSNGFFY